MLRSVVKCGEVLIGECGCPRWLECDLVEPGSGGWGEQSEGGGAAARSQGIELV